jgi:hypothetical protein
MFDILFKIYNHNQDLYTVNPGKFFFLFLLLFINMFGFGCGSNTIVLCTKFFLNYLNLKKFKLYIKI